MTIEPDQFAALLNECIINRALLSESEGNLVDSLQFQVSLSAPYTEEQALQLQAVYHAMTQRQYIG